MWISPRARPGSSLRPVDPHVGCRRGARDSAAGKVAFVAIGAGASASKSTNQIEAVGSALGRLWIVWRIHTPRPPSGRAALM